MPNSVYATPAQVDEKVQAALDRGISASAKGFKTFTNPAAADAFFTATPPAEDTLFIYTDPAESKADFYRRASDNTTQVLKEAGLTDADKAVTLDPNDQDSYQTGKSVGDYIQSKQDQRLDSEDRFVVITVDPAKLTEINTINHSLLKFKPKGNFRPEAKYSINEVVNANILKSFTVVQDIGGIQLNIAKYEVAQTEFDTAVESLTVPEFNNSGITFDITIDWGVIGLSDFDNVTPVGDWYINPLTYRENELLLNVFRDGITSGGNYQKVFDIEKAITSFELTGKVNLNAKYSIAAVRNEASVRLIVINETIDAVRTEVVRYEVSQGAVNTSKEVIDYTQGNFTLKATIDWSVIQNMVLTLFYEDRWELNPEILKEDVYKQSASELREINLPAVIGGESLNIVGVEQLQLLGWTFSGGEITSNNNGWNYYARINTVFQEDRFIQRAKIKNTTAGDFEIALGRRDNTRGSAVSIAKVGSDSFVKVYNVNNVTPTEVVSLRQTLPFDLLQDVYYFIEIEKNAFDITVRITSDQGYVYSFSFNDPVNVGTFWGRPQIYSIAGTTVANYFRFYYPQKNNTAAIIIGNSFVEGYDIAANNDEKYAVLLQEKLNGGLVILGKGGESTGSAQNRFYAQVDAFKFAKYCIIALGTNYDASFATYEANMNAMIAYLKSYGITPILETITPKQYEGYDYSFLFSVNDYVRNSGELFVDVNQAVTIEGSQTVWKPEYLRPDLVHPTVEGHAAIAARYSYDLPDIF